MSLVLLHPYFALLLLTLPLLWLSAGRQCRPGHKWLRALLFSTLFIALTQPTLLVPSQQIHQIFILDQSDGLSNAVKEQAQQRLRQQLAQINKGDSTTLIQIGGDDINMPVEQYLRLHDPRSRSSLSQALQTALDMVPWNNNSAIHLLTDGRATDPHWQQALTSLRTRHIPVNVIQLPSQTSPIYINTLAIDPARVGQAVRVMADIEGSGTDLTLSLFSGSRLLSQKSALTLSGQSHVELRFSAEKAGFLPLRAILTTKNQQPLSRFESIAAIQEPLSVIYLGAAQQQGAEKMQQLLGPGFVLHAVTPEQLPTTEFNDAQLVILDDLPAQQFPSTQQQRLLAAVRDNGVGLVQTGGHQAFAAGGYANTPLAEALPVKLEQEQQQKQPSTSLAIVIDSSGSMRGEPMELAKQLARLATEKLKPTDNIGIVEFYGNKQWSVPMQPASNLEEIKRAIGRMQAQGGSVLLPAIQEAYYGLKNTHTRFKHMLVITDAGVKEDNYQRLLRHIAQDKINISTALVGNDRRDEDKMVQWANWGQGRYYAINDEFSLVALDLNAPKHQPESSYRQGQFTLVPDTTNNWWSELALQHWPPLSAYSRVSIRPQAQQLMTLVTKPDPIVASWQYGIGRVTAFMVEPLGQGTQGWQHWSDYGRFLGAMMVRTANAQTAYDVQIFRHFEHITLQVRQLNDNHDALQAKWLNQDGTTFSSVALTEQAQGLFRAEQPFANDKAALLQLDDGHTLLRFADRAHSDILPERQVPEQQALPLPRLAKLTGGQYSQLSQTMPQGNSTKGNAAIAAYAWWPWLLLLGLVLYLSDILYRRWPRRRAFSVQDQN